MKVKVISWRGEDVVEVRDYVENQLTSSGCSEGVIENVKMVSEDTLKAFAKLCDILVERKILTAADLKEIAGDYNDVEVTG